MVHSESVSNNRIKSGYSRSSAPIDMVPHAGARMGTADGTEVTETSIAIADPEAGEGTLRPRDPVRTSMTLSPQNQIPHLQV